jgi:L-fucose isomerase-like protein
MSKRKMTMGVIVGNRGLFPAHLAKTGRAEMMQALEHAVMECVVLGPAESRHGAVESLEEANSLRRRGTAIVPCCRRGEGSGLRVLRSIRRRGRSLSNISPTGSTTTTEVLNATG